MSKACVVLVLTIFSLLRIGRVAVEARMAQQIVDGGPRALLGAAAHSPGLDRCGKGAKGIGVLMHYIRPAPVRHLR
jgi:hypothetical protein